MNGLRTAIASVALALQVRLAVLVWGPPGTGKSSVMMALGRALGLPVEVVIASIREPSDFAGLPVVREGGVDLAPPNWAKTLHAEGRGILFLDEVSCSPPATQAALLRVVLDRVVGDLTLPEPVSVAAAANPADQAAGGWDLSPPMANRFVHLDWPLDSNLWTEGMVSGWPEPTVPRLPSDWKNQLPEARAMVAAFVRARPTQLLQLPKEESQAGRAWPSPRSWEMAAIARAGCLAARVGDEVEGKLVAGCVGEGAALEYLAWQRELDLPDPEDLLRDCSKWVVPDRGDRLFATLGSVVAAVTNKVDKDRWESAWKVVGRAADKQADIAAAAAKGLASLRKDHPKLPAPKEAGSLLPLLRDAGLV